MQFALAKLPEQGGGPAFPIWLGADSVNNRRDVLQKHWEMDLTRMEAAWNHRIVTRYTAIGISRASPLGSVSPFCRRDAVAIRRFPTQA